MRKSTNISILLLVFVTILTSTFFGAADAQEGSGEEGECADGQQNNESTCSSSFGPLGEPSEYTESSTGVRLAVRRWIPAEEDQEVRAVAVFLHGGAGFHSGYADILGKNMKKHGIAMVAYDQVGSGYSGVIDEGLRGYFDSMDTIANDFSKIMRDTRTRYPGKKVFGMGESFGCFVLLHQILKEQKSSGDASSALADGYVFTGPVVKVLPEMLPPKPVVAVIKFLSKFFPLLKTPGTDFFSTFDLAFGDKRWALAGREDPFIQEAAVNPPRLRMIASVLTSMSRANNALEKVQVPFKIFVGEKEMRVDVGAIKKLAQVAKSKDKSIEIVEGAYHQLFQDTPEVTQGVCDGIKDWILARS